MISWPAPVAGAPVRGHVVVPGSKSASARSLLLAALAEGDSVLTGVLDSRDTALMRAGLAALGARFDDLADGRIRVRPGPVTGGGSIDCGLAGTVLRFLPPVAALAPQPTRFTGDAAAADRPVAGLLDALATLGADVSTPRRLPFTVAGGSLRGGPVSLDASPSSQFVSALLLTGARYPDGVAITHIGESVPSLPHIEMTCTLLRRRGVTVVRTGPSAWQVVPGPVEPLDEVVEPDLTNAASMLAAALATRGELSTAWPVVSVQAGDELIDVLTAFGARVSYSFGADGMRTVTVRAPDGVHGADVDLHAVSELTPVAAALAAMADGPSTIRGVAHIRGHETDRLAALASGLSGLGADVRETSDGLAVVPRPLHGGVFATHADHRLAHAAALLGLVTPGVVLDDVGCTTKTLPDFPGLWARLLGASG